MSFPYSLSPEAGLLLHALARNTRPRTVIETGTYIGISTIWLAAGLGADAMLHAFDRFLPIRRDQWHDDEQLTGRVEAVAASIERAGLAGRVRLHRGDSSFEVRRMHEPLRAGGVQLAFIDGDHSIDGAWLDLLAIEPVLSTGGYVVLHDVFPEHSGYDGPRHVVDHLRERAAGRYETCDLCLAPVNHGLTVMRRVG
jgi:predicted O-methyltransferase YrrM